MKLHVTVVCGQIIFWLLLLFTFIIRLKARLQPNIRLTLWRVLAVWSYPQRSYIIQISSKSVHRFLIPRGVEIFPITLAIGFYNSLYYRTTVIEKKQVKIADFTPVDASRPLTGGTTHWPHYVKISYHLQNWKYITYCIVVRAGPSLGHR